MLFRFLNQKINRLNVPYFEAVAVQGKGVFEPLTLLCRTVLKGIEAGGGTPAKRYPGKPETVPEAKPTGEAFRSEAPRGLPDSPRAKETPKPIPLKLKSEEIPQEPAKRSVGKTGGTAPAPEEKTRIVSCGQARILPPRGIQIPLTMEIDGLTKNYSLNLVIDIKEI